MTGHSFLDSHRDVSKTENAVKKHENVYSVVEYQSLLSGCISKPEPIVTRLANKFKELDGMISSVSFVNKPLPAR